MNLERFEFLKDIAGYFKKNPGASSYLGVSRQTCFSLLALHFSSSEEILDPTAKEFPKRVEEKVGLFEKNFSQNQPFPKTLPLPQELETSTQEWQEETVKQPRPQIPQLNKAFNGKLRNLSLDTFKKIKPEWTGKITQFLGKGKFLGKIGRLLGKVAGPIGMIVSTLVSKRVLKIIAATLLALYLLFMYLLGLLGAAIAGVIIGAIIGGFIGGPLGALVGAAIGGTTVFAIQHWVWPAAKSAWAGAGSALSGLWSGLGNLASGFLTGAANFVSGSLSAAGGAITSTGSFLAGLGGQLAGISMPSVALPVFGSIGFAAGGTLIVGLFVVGTAFMRQPTASESTPPVPSQNISVAKTVAPKNNYTNSELPTTVAYTLTISTMGERLFNIQVRDETVVTKEGSTPNVPPRSWSISEITTSWSQSYNLTLNQDFQNSAVTNTVTVTAEVEGAPPEQAGYSLTILVGSPPEDCPSGWPTTNGYITQGPNGPTSHQGKEAIDIGVTYQPVYATHEGMARVFFNDPCRGNYVEISGLCGGGGFTSRYLHLDRIAIRSGQIGRGTQIGVSGNSGSLCTTGPHLHYEFYSLMMGSPYIPIPRERILRCDSQAQCNVSW